MHLLFCAHLIIFLGVLNLDIFTSIKYFGISPLLNANSAKSLKFSGPSSPAAFNISEMTHEGPGASQDIIILNSDCSNEDD